MMTPSSRTITNMQLETLCERSKNISLFCHFLNLLAILLSQCYLLFQIEITTASNVPYDLELKNQQNINPLSLQYEICLDCFSNIVQSQKTCVTNSGWLKYAVVAGATLIEVFVDLPINLLLCLAIKYKKKTLLIPWLIFNLLRIVVIVVIVCLFVIFNIVGVGPFNGQTDIAVGKSEDNNPNLAEDNRYVPK